MGANSGKVFMTVTLPLIKDSFFSVWLPLSYVLSQPSARSFYW
jgi:ABC-type spermidine/putrescine transport system permease subunit II